MSSLKITVLDRSSFQNIVCPEFFLKELLKVVRDRSRGPRKHETKNFQDSDLGKSELFLLTVIYLTIIM